MGTGFGGIGGFGEATGSKDLLGHEVFFFFFLVSLGSSLTSLFLVPLSPSFFLFSSGGGAPKDASKRSRSVVVLFVEHLGS